MLCPSISRGCGTISQRSVLSKPPWCAPFSPGRKKKKTSLTRSARGKKKKRKRCLQWRAPPLPEEGRGSKSPLKGVCVQVVVVGQGLWGVVCEGAVLELCVLDSGERGLGERLLVQELEQEGG